jgi:dienelactone hydrolase
MQMTQEQTLTTDWGVLRYKLEATIAGQRQTIEAWQDGKQVHMQVEVGGQRQNKRTELRPHTLVLDNLIASHYQILLNSFSGTVTGNEEWWMLVPQRLAAIAARLDEAGEEAGTLNGQTLKLRKYTLDLGGTLVEFWAEAETNKLMRIFVPVQEVELMREGFALTLKDEMEPQSPAGFVERNLTFPSGKLNIPATLCLPAGGSDQVPAVVLVHGSGPHDRDETIGPNKPFRDLAHGLAGAGISTLRYDKRTFVFRHQIDPKTISLEEEVLEDALAALEYVHTLPEVNPEQIFLLGHSLGATVAPFIAERIAFLRGIIMLAPMARPIDETLADQTAYRLKVAGQSDDEIARQLAELKKAFMRVRSGEAADTEIVFFAPASYWRDLMSHDSLSALRRSETPVLVLQGGKDYQVTKADYDLVQQALAARPPSQQDSHWFPNLNHLFMHVQAESTGAEYGRMSHVDARVIETIATWIRAQVTRLKVGLSILRSCVRSSPNDPSFRSPLAGDSGKVGDGLQGLVSEIQVRTTIPHY